MCVWDEARDDGSASLAGLAELVDDIGVGGRSGGLCESDGLVRHGDAVWTGRGRR